MPAVSVIIPNYNHAPFLKQRIDSVLQQHYEDYEVLILDDCSTDDSRSLIETYRSHPRVTGIIYNEKNSGSVFRQWEKGITLAKGSYIWIAESDDWAHPDFLKTLVPILDADESIGLAYCDASINTSPSTEEPAETFADRKTRFFQTPKWRNPYTNTGQAEITEALLRQCTINNASSVLFRRQAILESNPFDISFRYIGDWYCYLKMCLTHKVSYTPLVLNYYRDHATNASRSLTKNLIFVEEFFDLFSWVRKSMNFVDKTKVYKLLLIHARHAMLSNISSGVPIYKRLFRKDPVLFLGFMSLNLKEAFKEKIGHK